MQQLKDARAALSLESAREKCTARRDILDAAVHTLEEELWRRELQAMCMAGTWHRLRAGGRSYCSRCGMQH